MKIMKIKLLYAKRFFQLTLLKMSNFNERKHMKQAYKNTIKNKRLIQ